MKDLKAVTHCPNCDAALRIAREKQGKRAKCPKCAETFVIEFNDDGSPEEEDSDWPFTPPIPKKLPSPSPEEGLSQSTTPTPEKRTIRDVRIPLWAMIAAPSVLSFIIGYFVGREHLKHQMFSAFTEGINGIRDGFGVREKEEPKPLKQLSIGETYTAEGFTIALTNARIEKPFLELLMSRGGPKEAEKPSLTCRFQVKNTDERKVLNFRDSSGYDDKFRLVDDVGNTIDTTYGDHWRLVGAFSGEVLPEATATHLIAFDIPLPKTEYLILTIDLTAVGGDGKIEYKFPYSSVEK